MAVTGKNYEDVYKEAMLYAQIRSDVAFDLTDPSSGIPRLIYESILEEWEMAMARKPFNRVDSMTEPATPNFSGTTPLQQYSVPTLNWYIEYKFIVASVALKLANLTNKQIQSAQIWYQQVLQEYNFQMARLYPGMAPGLGGGG
jgi:hypothetical protein